VVRVGKAEENFVKLLPTLPRLFRQLFKLGQKFLS